MRDSVEGSQRPSSTSHSRAIRSSRRAIALPPPAVFSTRIGNGGSSRSKVFAQLS
jgi:hypothetical protein